MEPQIKAAAGDVDAHTLRAGFGLPFREVSYASELGPPRPGSSAAAEGPGCCSCTATTPPPGGAAPAPGGGRPGFPALVLSYRNDPGARPAQTARAAAGGATGWRDVEAATSFALDHGATGRTLPLLGLPVPAPLTATARPSPASATPWTGAAWTTTGWHPSPTDPLRHLQRVRSQGRGVTRGRGSMRAWRLDLVRFR
jgi:hypothetical protein